MPRRLRSMNVSRQMRAACVVLAMAAIGALVVILGRLRERAAAEIPPNADDVPRGSADASTAMVEDAPPRPLPETLAETGLYADFDSRKVDPSNRPYSPQYPLWSDGASKRRWIRLPRGATIDASHEDAWRFPIGTKFWKEFSFGRPVETRLIERTASGWRFAAYVWSEDGRTATLAPSRGTFAVGEIAPGIRHRIPSVTDCRVCHSDAESPVLGFSAIQLSVDRDPNAVHKEPVGSEDLDLEKLSRSGWLRGFSGSVSPRIDARTPLERAALGYLHANCGMCHRPDGALSSLEMVLASYSNRSSIGAGGPIDTTLDRPSRRAPERMRIKAHAPEASLLLDRMRSRTAVLQMPPLGTQVVDDEAARVVAAWVAELDREGPEDSRSAGKNDRDRRRSP